MASTTASGSAIQQQQQPTSTYTWLDIRDSSAITAMQQTRARCEDAKEYLQRPNRADLWSVKWELAQTFFALGVFIAAAANSPWSIILPLCIALIIVSLLVVILDFIKIYRVREMRLFPVLLLCTDLIIVVIDCGITALWQDIENGIYDATVVAIAWALDTLLVLMSIATVVGRLMLRARDRKHYAIQAGVAIDLRDMFDDVGEEPAVASPPITQSDSVAVIVI